MVGVGGEYTGWGGWLRFVVRVRGWGAWLGCVARVGG